MSKIYVRIKQRKTTPNFFRCGIKFTKKWLEVEVDKATLDRLKAEQMLDVSEEVPADLEQDTPNADDSAGGSGSGTGSETPAAAPTDPAIRLEAVLKAIGQLDKADESLWTRSGSPKAEAISAITGWPVGAAERDAAILVAP